MKSTYSMSPKRSSVFSDKDFANYSEYKTNLAKYHLQEKLTRKNRVMNRADESRRKSRIKYKEYQK